MNITKQAREYYDSHNVDVSFGTFYNKILQGKNFEEAGKKECKPRGIGRLKLDEEISKYKKYAIQHYSFKSRNSLLSELKPIYEEWKNGMIELKEYENRLNQIHLKHNMYAI